MPSLIPLTSEGSQNLSVVINNEPVNVTVSYNSRMGVWTANFSTQEKDLNGIGLLGGVDLVKHFSTKLENIFAVNINNVNVDANSENLGSEVLLTFLTEEELPSNE